MGQVRPHSGTSLTPSSGPNTVKLGRQGRSLKVTTCGQTHPGKVRSTNQDHFLVATLAKAVLIRETSLPQPTAPHIGEEGHLFVVADGVGGHAGGEQASALAINSIESFTAHTLKWFFHLQGKEGDEALAEFQTALAQADARVFAEVAHHPDLEGMGTTLTMACSIDADLFVAHVGDSRCYLWREGHLYRLTRDHTLVQEMVRRGGLNPQEADHHPLRHVITNVIGGNRPGVEVEVHKARLKAGDLLMLCSDGLTEMVSEVEIARILQAEVDPHGACQGLIDRANDQGGKDNVTVVLARYEESFSSGRRKTELQNPPSPRP